MKQENYCVYSECKYITTSEKELVKHYHLIHKEKLILAKQHVLLQFFYVNGKSNYDERK
jgi:hypothetical protein